MYAANTGSLEVINDFISWAGVKRDAKAGKGSDNDDDDEDNDDDDEEEDSDSGSEGDGNRITLKADIHDNQGRTAVHYAAAAGLCGVLELLVKKLKLRADEA